MTAAGSSLRRLTAKLGFRLALLLSVALLPIGIISVMQTSAVIRESRAREQAALVGESLRAVISPLRLIRLAQGAAEAMSTAILPFVDDGAACSARMRALIESKPAYSFAGFIPIEGDVVCTSTGQAFNFRDTPEFQALVRHTEPSLNVNRTGPRSGASALYAAHPVWNDDKALIGFVSIFVPHATLAAAGGSIPSGLSVVTFDNRGEVLRSTGHLDEVPQNLPADKALVDFVGTNQPPFTANTVGGDERAFSVVSLVDDQLFVLASRPTQKSATSLLASLTVATIVPVLMWMASLVAAWVASEHLVSRHIRRLRYAITSFADGNRMARPSAMADAPAEIVDIAAAFGRMTEAVLRDEAELENSLHQKEVLLREVHHRVKNNLQLIVSIMNMQMRRVKAPETRVLMKSLQDRVMTLATIHRGLYQTSGLADVRADELLKEVIDQIIVLAAGREGHYDLESDIEDLRLTPDQAVPLALLLTEALNNAVQFAQPENGENPWLRVTLKRRGAIGALLEVAAKKCDGVDETAEEVEVNSLGAQLIDAFTQQLGGQLEEDLENGVYRLRVKFDLSPLSAAEERHVTNAQLPV